MKSRITLTIILLIVLLSALSTGSVLLSYLFYFSLAIIILSWLWIFLTTRGLNSHINKIPSKGYVGDLFEEEIIVNNSSLLPKLFLKVEGNNNLPGYQNVAFLNVSPKDSYRWYRQGYFRRRGRYNLGSLKATAADPFGLFSRQISLGQAQPVIVYPAIYRLPFFQPLLHEQSNLSLNRWLLNEQSPNAARVRDYTNGDSHGHIHWRSTAHTGKLMVKVFDPDHSNYAAKMSNKVWIILDMARLSQHGEGDETTEEYAVSITASLIKKYMENGKQVGLLMNGNQHHRFIADSGEPHMWQMYEALALIKADGDIPVEELLWTEKGTFDAGSIVMVVTASVTEQLKRPLSYLVQRGNMVITTLVNQASFGGSTGTATLANKLSSEGVQVYIVNKGQELAQALRD
jgi:uncharacterized protein (DUF58 family)